MASTKRNNVPTTRRRVIAAPDSPRATSPDVFSTPRHHHQHYHHRNVHARTNVQFIQPSRTRYTVPKAGDVFKTINESPPSSYTNRERRTSRYDDDEPQSHFHSSHRHSSSSRDPSSSRRLVQSFSGSDGEKATDVETRSGSYPSAYKSRSKDKDHSHSSDRQLRELHRTSERSKTYTIPPKSAPILIPSRGHDSQPPVLGPTPTYRRRTRTTHKHIRAPPPPVRRTVSSSSSSSESD